MEDYLSSVTLKDIMEKNGKKYYARLGSGQDFCI